MMTWVLNSLPREPRAAAHNCTDRDIDRDIDTVRPVGTVGLQFIDCSWSRLQARLSRLGRSVKIGMWYGGRWVVFNPVDGIPSVESADAKVTRASLHS